MSPKREFLWILRFLLPVNRINWNICQTDINIEKIFKRLSIVRWPPEVLLCIKHLQMVFKVLKAFSSEKASNVLIFICNLKDSCMSKTIRRYSVRRRHSKRLIFTENPERCMTDKCNHTFHSWVPISKNRNY